MPDPRDDQPHFYVPREHITEGVTPQRLRTEAKRSIRPTGFWAFGMVAALAIVVYLISNISQTFGSDTRTVRFAAPTAFGVFEGFDDVRYRGVPAGTIEKIERRGPQIILVAKIRAEFGPVFRDAKTELRPITPLNDEYLDIVDQGSASAGEADPDRALPAGQMQASVSVPDVLDGLQGDERRSFAILLDQLGNGAADRGVALRRAFAQVAPFLDGAGKLTRALAGRRQKTRRLVHNTSILAEELGNRQQQLTRLVRSGAVTLSALEEGAPDLDATLRELGPTFVRLRSSLQSVSAVVDDVDGGLRSVDPVARRLPEGLAAASRLNDDLSPTLKSLENTLGELNPFAIALTDVFRNVRDLGPALTEQVPVLDKITRDLVTCERGIIAFMNYDASIAKFNDKNGPIPRGTLVAGVPAVGLKNEALREFHRGCTPGTPVRGVVEPKDQG